MGINEFNEQSNLPCGLQVFLFLCQTTLQSDGMETQSITPPTHNQANTLFFNNLELFHIRHLANIAGLRFPNRNCQIQGIENNRISPPPLLKRKTSNRGNHHLKAMGPNHFPFSLPLRFNIPQTTSKHNQASSETQYQKHRRKSMGNLASLFEICLRSKDGKKSLCFECCVCSVT